MSETKGLLRLLFRRDDIVSRIRDEPLDIRSLTDAVNVSRPTVHRSLKALQQHDLVVETADGYVLTSYGKLVFDRYRSMLSGFEAVEQNRELLLGLENPAMVPNTLLDGATYVQTAPFAPEMAMSTVDTVVLEATTVRGLSPVVVKRYVSLFHEQVTTSGLDAEIITSPAVFEYIGTNWKGELEEAIRAGLNIFVADNSIPFGMILAEEPVETVCVLVYEEGSLLGVIQNDAPAVLEWARDLYDSYRRAARQPAVVPE